LLAVFDLSLGRFEAPKVVSLLETGPLRKRFGLREEDLETIHRWVQETGIRWGLDASWKRESGLPEVNENTWSFGIERLLLGYAMPSKAGEGFGSILPYDDIEGDSSEVLGSFVTYLTTLFACIRTLKEMHSPKEWSELLVSLFERLFVIDDELVPEANMIRSIFKRLKDVQDDIGLDGNLSLEVVRTYFGESVGRVEEGRNFLSGGVTFCAMIPMRSIPFKVVCMLGMNHADFPRQQRPKGFDLIAHMPRRGDCNRRSKDLYMFLEALLSARMVLYVSYIGQSIQDNAPIPPCTPVSTLMDYLDAGFRTEDGRPAGEAVSRRHPLQAFSPRYFSGDGPLFSYSRENAAAASQLIEGGRQDRIFMVGRLPEPGDEWKTLDIGLLCEFYRNPSKFLLTRRLLMGISDYSSSLDDFEPVDLSELNIYRLRQEHVAHLLGGLDHERSYRMMRMSGLLPHGLPGDVLFSKIRSESESFVRTVTGRISGLQSASQAFELTLGPFTLTGSLNTYGTARIVRYRPARMRASDLFSAWIHHLVLCSVSARPDAETCCIARDGTIEFRPAESCRDILAVILKYYWQGLTHPLPFFPETSLKYAGTGKRGGDSREERLKRAAAAWEGNRSSRGDSEDLSCRICFQGKNPLDEEFEEVAMDLLTPLLDHRRSG
ncbi:MAG TPA: exodeoxyribonuclease V subunit gamma, partial [Deltaproteobacteria bacterium]|nr:exodeoxyribonuclease V subunit gamma [Deltaproteobacteria bacterium]